jgi:hypothetical protein
VARGEDPVQTGARSVRQVRDGVRPRDGADYQQLIKKQKNKKSKKTKKVKTAKKGLARSEKEKRKKKQQGTRKKKEKRLSEKRKKEKEKKKKEKNELDKMKLDEVARLVVAHHESTEGNDGHESRVIVAEWRGNRLLGSAHVHVDRLKYRGMMVPRCAKRAVLFLAARIVERARETGTVVVAGHGDGGIVAALAAECARTELAFDASAATRRVVRSVSFGAPMRYPVRADVRVVSVYDARALYPCGARCGRFVFLGPTDTAFYARMAMALVGQAVGTAVGAGSSSSVAVSMREYADACADALDTGPCDPGGPSGHTGPSGPMGPCGPCGPCGQADRRDSGYRESGGPRYGDESGLEWVVVGE